MDGSVFIGDGVDYRIRRIGPDGIITTYAGTGTQGGAAEGRATTVGIAGADGLVVDGDGNLYLSAAGSNRIQRVTPDGMMSTWLVGSPADFWPRDLALGPDGAMYITHSTGTSARIYKRDPDGNLSVFAGGPLAGPFGSYATATELRASGSNPLPGLGVAPDGAVYFAQGEVARIAPALARWLADAFVVPEADGSVLHSFDARGRHLHTRDALTGGIRHRFEHDAAGRLVAIHDADGDATVIERDGNGVPLRIIAPYGERTELGLDGNGYLHTVTNPAGETITLTNGSDGLLLAYRDAGDREHAFTYHPDGRLHIDDDPAGGSQTLTRSTGLNTNAVERRTGEGRTTNYVVSTYYPPSGATPAVVERWTTGPDLLTTRRRLREDGFHYADYPNGVFTIDSLVPDSRFELLAPLRRMQRIRMPSGITQTIKTEHPTAGSAFDPPATNGTWVEKVTVNGHPPIELSINTTVSPALMTLKTSAGRVFLGRVDSLGRLRTLIAPGQDSVLLSYDARGRPTRRAQGARSLRYRYDLGDPFGRLEQVIDTLGRTVAFTYDSAGRVTRQDLPGGRTVTYAYDANGNLSSLTPPGRPAHGFVHTAVNLVEEYIPPDIGLAEERTRYGYDLDRQLETILRPDGVEVTLGYDGAGRLETVTVPEGAVDLDYDGASRLESIASAGGAVTVSYGYDGDLVTSETWSGAVAGTVGYTYDRDFRVRTQSVNGSSAVTYTYDDDGLLEQAGALDVTRSASTGQLLGTTLGSVTTSTTYDVYGEPLLSAALSGTDTLWRAVYGRDALGRINGISENVLGTVTAWGYAYSDTGFLSVVTENGVAVERYDYDGNGNRTRFEAPGYGVDADHDDQDRLTQYGDTLYTYTAAGELAERIVGSDTTRYSYDPLGNLLKVRFSATDSVEYLVDGRNRRVARIANGDATHRWLYQDQLEPVAEVDGAGVVVARYVYGTRGHVPDYVVKGDSTYRIVSNHLGSVRLVVNVASGWVAQRLEYDGYGRVVLDTNPGFQGFGYAGGLWDAATGLTRFGARDYDASVGRWTARDPIGFAGGSTGLFEYAGNDPINIADPTGLLTRESAVPRQQPEQNALDQLLSDLPSPSPGVVDALAGAGDALLLYAPVLVRSAQGIDDVVNPCSDQYRIGQELGHLAQAILLTKGVGPGGVLNKGRQLRIGFARFGGNRVFRIAGELVVRYLKRPKIDIWKGGPL